MTNETCAVVVTYNRKNLLEQAVQCLLQQSCPCDILVVDNASTDGTEELIKTFTDIHKDIVIDKIESPHIKGNALKMGEAGFMEIFPDTDKSDGFFLCRLKKL
jgi:glycosyltransferase involved in cell wall biosynthesis